MRVRCPDCSFVAQGRTEREALDDFTNNSRHVCDPPALKDDPAIRDWQLRSLEHADKAREQRRTGFPDDCPKGCSSGWIPYEHDGIDYAAPCPIHKPDWVHPSLRPTQKERNEAIRDQKKQEASTWL